MSAMTVNLEASEPWDFVPLVVLTAAFVLVAAMTGEQTRWQWGVHEEGKYMET